MLRLSLLEVIFRTIPETLILIYGVHIMCRKSINMKKYIISSLTLSILIFLVRCLPVCLGVHTEICIVLTIAIMFVIGIPLIEATENTFLIYFLLALSEILNMMILGKLDEKMSALTPFFKCLYGIPSLILFMLFIMIVKNILKSGFGFNLSKEREENYEE